MRVVVDTNILISALLVKKGNPDAIYRAWQRDRFTLLISAELIAELTATLKKPTIAAHIKPYNAGRLVNQIRASAKDVGKLPKVERSPDPSDDFLLAMAEAGEAKYLVSGDKSGLIGLETHKGTRILKARDFVELI